MLTHKQPDSHCQERSISCSGFISYLRAGRPGQGSRCLDAVPSGGSGTPRGCWCRSHTWGSCTSWRLRVCPCGECVCGCFQHNLTYQVWKQSKRKEGLTTNIKPQTRTSVTPHTGLGCVRHCEKCLIQGAGTFVSWVLISRLFSYLSNSFLCRTENRKPRVLWFLIQIIQVPLEGSEGVSLIPRTHLSPWGALPREGLPLPLNWSAMETKAPWLLVLSGQRLLSLTSSQTIWRQKHSCEQPLTSHLGNALSASQVSARAQVFKRDGLNKERRTQVFYTKLSLTVGSSPTPSCGCRNTRPEMTRTFGTGSCCWGSVCFSCSHPSQCRVSDRVETCPHTPLPPLCLCCCQNITRKCPIHSSRCVCVSVCLCVCVSVSMCV